MRIVAAFVVVPSQRLPVMVYIHGGFLAYGSSGQGQVNWMKARPSGQLASGECGPNPSAGALKSNTARAHVTRNLLAPLPLAGPSAAKLSLMSFTYRAAAHFVGTPHCTGAVDIQSSTLSWWHSTTDCRRSAS